MECGCRVPTASPTPPTDRGPGARAGGPGPAAPRRLTPARVSRATSVHSWRNNKPVWPPRGGSRTPARPVGPRTRAGGEPPRVLGDPWRAHGGPWSAVGFQGVRGERSEGSRRSLEGRWGTPGVLGGPWSVGGALGRSGVPRGKWGGRRPRTETPAQGTRGPALTQRALGERSGRP